MKKNFVIFITIAGLLLLLAGCASSPDSEYEVDNQHIHGRTTGLVPNKLIGSQPAGIMGGEVKSMEEGNELTRAVGRQ